ncbi:MAG: carboxypeptidase regulatory-like domain-containing protein [Acidobacteriota bacterium]
MCDLKFSIRFGVRRVKALGRASRLCFLPLVMLVWLPACGGGAPEEAPKTTEKAAAPETTELRVDATTAGTVVGKVTYTGKPSRGARIRMNADPKCAEQHKEPVYSQVVAVNDNGTLRDAFVWVKAGLEQYKFGTPSEAKELDQKGCVYEPHVFGLQVGQKFKILNGDPTTHNIHPVPRQNREWNTSQPPNAQPMEKSFPRPEVMIPVKCNIHPWMKAYIGVVAHPYFAVTGTDGSFELKGLPPGDYTIGVWHEKLGTSELNVTLGEKETKEIEFTYSG